MTQQREQYVVDAFSARAFGGNPAAIVFEHRDEAWMQSLAAENNLAETAYLKERDPRVTTDDDGAGRSNADVVVEYDIRWFTPTNEVDLCGHATLAAAHALYESGRVSKESGNVSDYYPTIYFHTKNSGILTATGRSNGLIELNFPSTPPVPGSLSDAETEAVITAFGLQEKNEILFAGHTPYDIFLEVAQESFRRITKVDLMAVRSLGGRGIIVTCRGDPMKKVPDKTYDFSSRCFFPCAGIDEDPVTGSAHCALAPYWFNKLEGGTNEDLSSGSSGSTNTNNTSSTTIKSLVGYQASARGGEVVVSMAKKKGEDRVLLAGPCVTVMKSVLLV